MDRVITITRNPKPFTTGGWVNQKISWRTFASGLCSPLVGAETFEEYLKAGKKEKTEIKSSSGGYVGGAIDETGYRRRHHMRGRDLVTLDFDHLAPGDDKVINSMCSLLGCDFVIHSSQSHTAAAPRVRVIIPLSRTVNSADEYAAVSRKLAFKIDPSMSKLDKTTHEYERLMFYPRHSKDAPFLFIWAGQNRQDVPLCDVDVLLSEYMDWHNQEEWPKAPENDFPVPTPDEKRLKRDPEERAEPIGSFCRFFSMDDAIQFFLSDVYEPVDSDASGRSRYTYIGGTSAAGAVVYDDKFLFSHHDTDPAGGKTLNAFELIQLHRYGYLDEEANAKRDILEPWNEKRSYAAMCQWVQSDGHPELVKYREAVVREKGRSYDAFMEGLNTHTTAEDDFGDVVQTEIVWGANDLEKDGSVKPTLANMQRIIAEDPMLKGKIRHDVIKDRIVTLGDMPWHIGDMKEESELRCRSTDENGWRTWAGEPDEVGLRTYLERKYGIQSNRKSVVLDALGYVAKARLRNGVVEYLNSLVWDGVPRIDTLFVDYLGAEDNPTTRAATRKALLGCVYRAYAPGCKFDQMCVLIGPQGIGKSTILRKLAGDAWFTDSIHSFEGPKVAEAIRGAWIVEIGELHALRKAEVGQVRQILACCEDRVRFAYARDVSENPRHCIFFGTGNDREVVRDMCGERRFWIIETGVIEPTKSVWDQFDLERDQLWAEAVAAYRAGESLEVSREVKDDLLDRQSDFRDADPWESAIREFLTRKVPSDWAVWPIERRLDFWARFDADTIDNGETDDYSSLTGPDGNVVGALVERDRVTASEIWSEFLSGSTRYTKDKDGVKLTKADKKRINNALKIVLRIEGERTIGSKSGDKIPGVWRYDVIRNGPHKRERGFLKIR